MKDYSNYHTNRKDKIVHDGIKLFDYNTEGFSGQNVIINNDVADKLIVYDKYSASQTLKTIIAKIKIINYGDIVQLEDESIYLITKRESQNAIIEKWISTKCNIVLKWVDGEGVVQSSPTIFEYNAKSNFGIEEGRVMSLPDGRRQLILPKNETTMKIAKREKRFIIGGSAFKVTESDYVSDDGLIYLSLSSDQINPSIDSQELEIADYYNNIAKYEILILNDDFHIGINQTLQLNVEVMKNGSLVNSSIIFESHDESILIIGESGLINPISVGATSVSVTAFGVTKTIDITVRDIQMNNYTTEIIGSDTINSNQSKVYEILFKNNGEIIDESFDVSLFADDGISETKIAKITTRIENKITLLADKSLLGYVQLHVTSLNGLFTNSKRIRIKTFI